MVPTDACSGVKQEPVSGVFDSEPELWSHINAVMEDRKVGLVLSPTLEVHVPEQWRERYVTAGYGELTKWTSMVRAAVYDGRVIHRGQTMLSEHIARAVGVNTQAGYTLSSTKSPGPIELARLLVWSVALASKPVQPKRKPAMGAG